MELIISGYGSKPQTSLALYQLQKDKLSSMEWQDTIEACSFVCQGDGYLFGITEAEEYAYVYLYQRVGNQYQFMDQRQLGGSSLCHITYSSKNKALFGACYGTGTVFSIRVRGDKFGEILFHEKQLGTDLSSVSRAHCVLLNKEENKLIVTNIALDKIYFYEISDGRLSNTQEINMPMGVGPRHASLSQDEKFLYIITEYSNEIFVFQNDQEKQLIQKIATLTAGYSGISNCSSLCFSKTGAYLYAANRGADTISLFAVNENGKLRKIEEYNCGGKHPRHMIISKDGGSLVVCNQQSDQVIIYELDIEKGFIKSRASQVSFTSPSGVVEV